MKICITLDDVIRAKTKQFGKFYQKAINPDVNLDELEIKSPDMSEVFEFEDKKKYNEFLYTDYAFEIFGEAGVCEKMLDKSLNLWLIALNDDDELKDNIEIIIANPFEFNASIGFTYFFLSKIGCRVRNIYLPEDSSKIWDVCDVLITADNRLIEKKPEGKKCIKISAPYNKEINTDYSYDSFVDFLEDDEILNKLIENKDE